MAGCSELLDPKSESNLIQVALPLKHWLQGPPEISVVRPPCCPSCKRASQEPGRRINLQGHGLRARQVRGVLGPGDPPRMWTIRVRRFLCLACGATMTVGPAELVAGRWYTWPSIVRAWALLGIEMKPALAVRQQSSPWRSESPGWRQLGRWTDAVGGARADGESRRDVARRLALRAAASASSCLRLTVDAAWAGAMAAWDLLGSKPSPPWRSIARST